MGVWKTIKTKTGKKVRRYVSIAKSGKWKFLKSPSRSRSKSKTKTEAKKVRRLVRRYRRRRRGGGKSMTRTAFKLVRLGALAAPAIMRLTKPGTTTEYKMQTVLHDYCGWWDGNWKLERMLNGWGPYIGACLATYGIPKLVGIIRRL